MEGFVMKKRLLTWVLCVTMLCSLVPGTVLAARVDNFATATPITVGEAVSFSVTKGEDQYYSFQSTKAGQWVYISRSSGDSYTNTRLLASNGDSFEGGNYLSKAGTYYLELYNNRTDDSGTFTVTLIDNDEYEPNDSQETATPLRFGDSVDIKLDNYDEDWFCIETTKDGQDVQLDVSGFTYNNQGRFQAEFDGESYRIDNYYYTETNGTHYFHASKAGKHYLTLSGYRRNSDDNNAPLSLTVKATLLDGDGNECNDTKETATKLALGTDKTFSLGGWGDEDWFSFDVEESGGLYTLRFLDLNPDYSDNLLYEVYAPSGEKVVSETAVDIAHSVIFSCTEQGAYYVRVYTGFYHFGNGRYFEISRSPLRIRVSPGGSDPYESNDTWLTAKPIQVGQLTQHVLSSTADEDWFWFTAPEADMGFQFTTDRTTNAYLYRAADLAEHGVDSDDIINSQYGSYACKLDEAGVYYLRLTTDSSYATEELRSFTVTLTSPGSEENNDSWDRATPLFESVPQRFDLFGYNDTDWFKITVPEGAAKLHIKSTHYCYALYSETDIKNSGLDTAPIIDHLRSYSSSDFNSSSVSVIPGTYYLKVIYTRWSSSDSNKLITDQTVSYSLTASDGSTFDAPMTLAQNTWSDPLVGNNHIALGELKAGDVVRFDRDSCGYGLYVQLRNSEDKYVEFFEAAHDGCVVPADGTYYLWVESLDGLNDSNSDTYKTRIRYTISPAGSEPATAISGPDTIDLYVGQKQYVDVQLTPIDSSSNGSNVSSGYYTCKVSDDSVAEYRSGSGYVTAKAEGKTTLTFTCTVGSNTVLTKTITVNVKAAPEEVTGLAISGAPTSALAVGDKVYLTADLTPEGAAADVSWSSSDSSILYVFPGGKVVAVGEGSATVTATAGGKSASVTIQTKAAAPTVSQISSMTLDQYALTLYVGEEGQKLTATVLPKGIDAKITWTSSNASAATVAQDGTVRAVAPGVSIITAKAGDHNVSCVVTVQAARVRVESIRFDAATLSLPLGSTSRPTVTITPSNATTKSLTWVSDDPGIASVTRSGEITALAVGTTTIRATSLDGGKTAELTIEVTASPQLGDVNGDGYIDAADAMLCMRSFVELVTLTKEQLTAADVNHDGVVDAGDAVKILRYSVGLIQSL